MWEKRGTGRWVAVRSHKEWRSAEGVAGCNGQTLERASIAILHRPEIDTGMARGTGTGGGRLGVCIFRESITDTGIFALHVALSCAPELSTSRQELSMLGARLDRTSCAPSYSVERF